MRPVATLLLLLGLLIALGGPLASAQNQTKPAPPAGMVVEVTRVETWNPDDASFQSWFNVTFPLSPQDPDQINGDFLYTMWINGVRVGENVNFTGCGGIVCSGPIPQRPGWAFWLNDLAASGGIPTAHTINLTAKNASSLNTESLWSCSVTIDLIVNGSHEQCGVNIEPPPGVSLLSLTRSRFNEVDGELFSIPAITDIRWHLSPDDTNQTSGEFDYYVYQGPTPGSIINFSGATPQFLSPGLMNFSIETFSSAENARFPLYARVLARDPYTHQRSSFSCTAYVTSGAPFGSGGCGTLSTSLHDVLPETPTFPFANLTQSAEFLGISINMVGGLMGGATLMGLVLAALTTRSMVLANVAGTILMGLLASFSIIPIWVYALTFLASISYVVLKLIPQGGES
jgi:hypothetical protein